MSQADEIEKLLNKIRIKESLEPLSSDAVLGEVAPVLTDELLSSIVRFVSRSVIHVIEWEGECTVHDIDLILNNIKEDIKRGAI